MRATPLLGFCECSDGGLCHPGSSTRLQTHARGCGAQDGREDSGAHRCGPFCTSTELRGGDQRYVGRGSQGAASSLRRGAGAAGRERPSRIWTHCSLSGEVLHCDHIRFEKTVIAWCSNWREARRRLGQAL